MERLVIANLDAEVEMAGGPRLGAAVRALISRAGCQMAVLAQPGDRLWTPEPVEPGDAPAGLRLESGPPGELAPADRVVAWAETPTTAALRRHEPPPPDRDDPIALAWSAVADPDVARRCNHRRFAFELAHERGIALPGAVIVGALADLDAQLVDGIHRASASEQWVAKAPLAAAGRDRVRRRGGALDHDARIRLGRLLALHGELVLEPWHDRVDDFGCAGVIAAGEVRLFPPHRLINNPAGVFRGIAPADDPPPEIAAAAAIAGDALAAAGYAGPFGIDGYRYRMPGGAMALHPLSEINARFTHGFLAAIAAGAPLRRVSQSG